MPAVIEDVERHALKLPFRDLPERNMARELPHWRYVDIYELELENGVRGLGETMPFYTWDPDPNRSLASLIGRNAAKLVWQDQLGPGLQMAATDAVARSLAVPIHELLGEQKREATPLSWWCIDMPPADLVAEAERARAKGYTALKMKARPWFDLRAQLAVLADALPPTMEIDLDFNGTLLDAKRATPLLQDVTGSPQVSHLEEPLPPTDHAGNRELRSTCSVPIVQHYEEVVSELSLEDPSCDGFVVTGGSNAIRDAGAVSVVADRPFWLQLVGSEITAAFTIQCGAVAECATWPAVTCHQLFDCCLLNEPIEVRDGLARVPEGAGLGYELDRATISEFKCDRPQSRPTPPRLIESNWPDGPTLYFGSGKTDFMLQAAQSGQLPYFRRGVETRIVPNDGSQAWDQLYETATSGPVRKSEPVI